jgi:hypothetical protein
MMEGDDDNICLSTSDVRILYNTLSHKDRRLRRRRGGYTDVP